VVAVDMILLGNTEKFRRLTYDGNEPKSR